MALVKGLILFLSICDIGILAGKFDQFPDCENLGCPLDAQPNPVCGTDGKTYNTPCELELENEKRFCWIGHFNMIYKLHYGPCYPTTTVTFTG